MAIDRDLHQLGEDRPKAGITSLKARWAFIMAIVQRAGDGNIGLVAAGVAFYAMLGVFPALAALVSLYGLIADPYEVQRQINLLDGVLPDEAIALLDTALSGLVAKSTASLNIGVVIGVALSLFTARAAVGSLMTGLDIAYGTPERRGFLHSQIVGLGLTCALIGVALVALTAVTIVPLALTILPLPPMLRTSLGLVRWLILGVIVALALAFLYRRGPSKAPDRWVNVRPGALFATVMWLAGSILFSAYVTWFGRYDAMYGSLGAVVVLLLWLWITALIVLIGAVINSEIMQNGAGKPQISRAKPLKPLAE